MNPIEVRFERIVGLVHAKDEMGLIDLILERTWDAKWMDESTKNKRRPRRREKMERNRGLVWEMKVGVFNVHLGCV